VASALDEARRLGYRRVRLDTVPGMEQAQALYEQLGFQDIAPYTDNPIAATRFLELVL
jgi:ribosomal protein S18 acetylase RimI-like enzyme